MEKSEVEYAIRGTPNLYEKDLVSIPYAAMEGCLTPTTREYDIQLRQWVRINDGDYQGDLAQVVGISEKGDEMLIILLPRINLATETSDGSNLFRLGSPGKAVAKLFKFAEQRHNPHLSQSANGTWWSTIETKQPENPKLTKLTPFGHFETVVPLSLLDVNVTPNRLELASFRGAEPEVEAVVVRVSSGDTMTVHVLSTGKEKRVRLSSIRAPKGPAPKPAEKGAEKVSVKEFGYDMDAKEFLRSRLIGKRVRVSIDYVMLVGSKREQRECVTVKDGDKNISELILSEGLADLVPYEDDDDSRSPYYDQLLIAFNTAKAAQINIHSQDDAPVRRISDASFNAERAMKFLPQLQAAGKLQGVVEAIASASRFRVYVPSEKCFITLNLSGVQTPWVGRSGEKSEPFGPEAFMFVAKTCMQRDVEFSVEGVDGNGEFFGSLFIKSVACGWVNVAILLLLEGFATIDEASANQSTNAKALRDAEEKAKSVRKGVWKNWSGEGDANVSVRRATYGGISVVQKSVRNTLIMKRLSDSLVNVSQIVKASGRESLQVGGTVDRICRTDNPRVAAGPLAETWVSVDNAREVAAYLELGVECEELFGWDVTGGAKNNDMDIPYAVQQQPIIIVPDSVLPPDVFRLISRLSHPQCCRALRCTSSVMQKVIQSSDVVRSEARWRCGMYGPAETFAWAVECWHVDIILALVSSATCEAFENAVTKARKRDDQRVVDALSRLYSVKSFGVLSREECVDAFLNLTTAYHGDERFHRAVDVLSTVLPELRGRVVDVVDRVLNALRGYEQDAAAPRIFVQTLQPVLEYMTNYWLQRANADASKTLFSQANLQSIVSKCVEMIGDLSGSGGGYGVGEDVEGRWGLGRRSESLGGRSGSRAKSVNGRNVDGGWEGGYPDDEHETPYQSNSDLDETPRFRFFREGSLAPSATRSDSMGPDTDGMSDSSVGSIARKRIRRPTENEGLTISGYWDKRIKPKPLVQNHSRRPSDGTPISFSSPGPFGHGQLGRPGSSTPPIIRPAPTLSSRFHPLESTQSDTNRAPSPFFTKENFPQAQGVSRMELNSQDYGEQSSQRTFLDGTMRGLGSSQIGMASQVDFDELQRSDVSGAGGVVPGSAGGSSHGGGGMDGVFGGGGLGMGMSDQNGRGPTTTPYGTAGPSTFQPTHPTPHTNDIPNLDDRLRKPPAIPKFKPKLSAKAMENQACRLAQRTKTPAQQTQTPTPPSHTQPSSQATFQTGSDDAGDEDALTADGEKKIKLGLPRGVPEMQQVKTKRRKVDKDVVADGEGGGGEGAAGEGGGDGEMPAGGRGL
ncbi:hypothetical protein HDV00_012819 [Rhizophlyctis rosea]|nr:hypothetical protein HDV00_012819 [Rhizophlyctis rosea]